MSDLRFAVAGFKHFHILEFVKGMQALPGAKLVGIYDDDPQLLATYQQEYNVPDYDSIDKLVEEQQPEVVGLAMENSRKADTIAQLTKLGCHVLADKPLVTSHEQLDLVQKSSDENNRQVGLMLLERYNAPTRTFRDQLAAGDYGKLVSFTGLAPHKLKPSGRPTWMFEPDLYGGVLNDLAIHNVDLVRWLWGQEPTWVSAVEGCLRFTDKPGFSDHAEIMVAFEDSSTAFLRADWLTPESHPTHGDGRQIFECTNATVEIRAAPDIHELGKGEVVVDRWEEGRTKLELVEPARTLYEEFVAQCRGEEGDYELTPADAIASTRLTLHAADAARRGELVRLW